MLLNSHCYSSAASDVYKGLLLQETLRDVTRLRAEIDFVTAGTLPDDGKLVEDARAYD